MIYGLMIDDVKTEKVTAQVVVYNAELGYFSNVMVFFEFTDGGKIEVSHSVNTIGVELYETPEDWGRFAMEVLLAVGAVYSVYEEVVDFISSKKTKGSYMAYFASMWNYIDVASIAIHLATIIMWFIFSWSRARVRGWISTTTSTRISRASAFIDQAQDSERVPRNGRHVPRDEEPGGLHAAIHDALRDQYHLDPRTHPEADGLPAEAAASSRTRCLWPLRI